MGAYNWVYSHLGGILQEAGSICEGREDDNTGQTGQRGPAGDGEVGPAGKCHYDTRVSHKKYNTNKIQLLSHNNSSIHETLLMTQKYGCFHGKLC